MKKISEKSKQIILTIIAILLMIVGYAGFNVKDEEKIIAQIEENEEENLGDVQLVNSEPQADIVPNEENSEQYSLKIAKQKIEDKNENKIENKEENKIENKEENKIENKKEDKSEENTEEKDYFLETKLERERTYSEMIEMYQNIISNTLTPDDQKAIAVQEINNIAKNKNKIMITENLIQNKGFQDVLVLVNNESISVVVKARILSTEEVSQIQNIIQREFNTDIKNINISNKN